MKIKVLAASFLFLILAPLVSAENELPVRVKVWPKKVTVGDEIRLILEVVRPKNFTVHPPPLETNLNPFEIKSVRALPTIQKEGLAQDNFELVVTVFQTGEQKIPPVSLEYTDGAGRRGRILSPPATIQVASVVKDAKTVDIRPIKDVLSLSLRTVRAFFEALLALLLSVFLAVKIYLRKRRREPVDPESLKPPHERAILELERLQRKGFIEAGKLKDYYSELSGILRQYLERRFQVEALERTTAEIEGDLKQRNFETGVRRRVQEVLENSDLVKFANFAPAQLVADQLVQSVIQIVEMTKGIPL